jgi:hypothetical protein
MAARGTLESAAQRLAQHRELTARLDANRQALSRREQHLEKFVSTTVGAHRQDEIDAQLSQIRIKPKMVEDLDALDRRVFMWLSERWAT